MKNFEVNENAKVPKHGTFNAKMLEKTDGTMEHFFHILEQEEIKRKISTRVSFYKSYPYPYGLGRFNSPILYKIFT